MRGPVHIHGAEIDLVAESKTDPFGPPIYIEATVEYVDNAKYGKDVSKLAMIAAQEPDARKLIVSSRGFSKPVSERAKKSRIDTITNDGLFKKFERFEPYISLSLEDSTLRRLSDVYVEATFSDSLGNEEATKFLADWRVSSSDEGKWILITGEYGTGKTALTRVLLYRWLEEYQKEPGIPLPIRIELREFTRQFDARGLLFNFLEHHGLSHLSLDFVFDLVHAGRVVLILDGYDEMAQYLHTRERRACLEALAELSAGGARGIITSRPNFFTETEEFRMFDILYRSLDGGRYTLGVDATELLKREQYIDRLLEQFIDRYERSLSDLTPAQTESLINRVLSDDPAGREVVRGLLYKLFRPTEGGAEVSLSGKPVIVSYLLEVVEDLKSGVASSVGGSLTE